MRRLFQKLLLSAAAVVLFTAVLPAQSKDFRAAQRLDIFHSLLRELSMFYVDSVAVDELVETGMDAMLETLDPYTVYLPEELADDFDFVTTGQYGGMGALIRKVPDGVEISEPYRGFPADRAGLVAGDLLLEINGQPTRSMEVSAASTHLKGVAGTTLALKVVKLRSGDTVNMEVRRERIHISDIGYAGLLHDSIGYIRVSSFTRDGSRDFKQAFVALQQTGRMKKLVIDVRANGGGLLDEAVNIVGLFVPRGTEVVSARGRMKEFALSYKTRESPLDTELPLAVLVNSLSASAAEILAGSLQDLDRAVVVGTRTFGKGLVQSVRSLGYNAQLKITTAKYYIPSGRCVQAIDYAHRNDDGSVGHIPDSLIRAFKTRAGRVVYDGGGIRPDSTVASPAWAKITYDILARDLLRDYSILYYKVHDSIAAPEEFRLSDAEYGDFVEFAVQKEFDDRTAAELLLEQLAGVLKAERLQGDTEGALGALRAKINRSRREKLLHFRPELQQLLEEEICCRYYYEQGRLRNLLLRDRQTAVAVDLLNNTGVYEQMLRP